MNGMELHQLRALLGINPPTERSNVAHNHDICARLGMCKPLRCSLTLHVTLLGVVQIIEDIRMYNGKDS
jgi:hypothetical protein